VSAAEVHHHRDVRDRSGFYGTLHGREVRPRVMGGFDADDHALVPLRHLGGGPGVHVLEVLLVPSAAHAVAHDVQEREHPRLAAVHHQALELLEVAPPGTAGVGHRRHAGAERERVRGDAAVACIGIALAGAGEDVDVDIDQPRRHVQAGNVHGLQRRRRVDLRRDCCDLSVADGHVADRAHLVPGVDDVAAAQEEIVLLRSGRCARDEQADNDRQGEALRLRHGRRPRKVSAITPLRGPPVNSPVPDFPKSLFGAMAFGRAA
jgi:hypothetical protein